MQIPTQISGDRLAVRLPLLRNLSRLLLTSSCNLMSFTFRVPHLGGVVWEHLSSSRRRSIVGSDAEDKILDDDYVVISSAKRLMGKNVSDVKDFHLISQIIQNQDKILYDGLDDVTPIEVSRVILTHLKEIAQRRIGQN